MKAHVTTPTERAVAFKKLKDKVEFVLSKYENARNDDIECTIAVWQEFYRVGDAIALEQLKDLPRESAIVRLRAVIQNVDGKYFPTDLAIARKRGIEEVAWQEYMVTVKNPQRSLFGL